MTDTTPRAGAPLLAANQAQKSVTHNEALYQFDALLCARFLDRDRSAPPSSPADGDTYLVKATGTGAWTGQDGKIAYCADGGWRFYAPFMGLVVYVADESALIVFNGTSWVDYGSLVALENIPMIGVNTTADTTNKLAVKSAALLFDNIGHGTQLKLNKNASGDTASVLYQTGYSGRAEIGTTGDDNFHFKVSADGSVWHDALDITATTGVVTLASAVLTTADINGGTVDSTAIGSSAASTGKFTTLQASGAVTLSPASAAVAISPTGAGTVAIAPAGALTVNPAAASTIDNCSIGATTPSTGAFTSVTMGSVVGTAGVPNKLGLFGTTYGFGISAGSLNHVSGGSHTFYASSATVGTITSTGLNGMNIGATTAAAGVFTTLQATASLKMPTVANGSVATAMSSLGPTGAHTTVQEWFAILNASGTTRYVPAF